MTFVFKIWQQTLKKLKNSIKNLKTEPWKILPRWAPIMTQEVPTLASTRSATKMVLKLGFVQMMYKANIGYYFVSKYKYVQTMCASLILSTNSGQVSVLNEQL